MTEPISRCLSRARKSDFWDFVTYEQPANKDGASLSSRCLQKRKIGHVIGIPFSWRRQEGPPPDSQLIGLLCDGGDL